MTDEEAWKRAYLENNVTRTLSAEEWQARVVALWHKLGWTQERLGRELRVPQQTIARWLAADRLKSMTSPIMGDSPDIPTTTAAAIASSLLPTWDATGELVIDTQRPDLAAKVAQVALVQRVRKMGHLTLEGRGHAGYTDLSSTA